jgi:NADH-quinone oxidoreductase subunit J
LSRARIASLTALAWLAPCGVALAQTAAAAPAEPTTVSGAIGFWLLSLLTVGGAIATVLQRNTVSAVMALVATFFGVAGLFLLLSAQFLAAIEVLVYAGAIMTLFVFVVMVLNREETEPFTWRGWITKSLGVVCVAYVCIKGATLLFLERPVRSELPPPDFGGVTDVGWTLFTRYLFPFEALSLMLLVAVIGAVVVARTPRRHSDDHSGGLSHIDDAEPAVPASPPAGH